MFEVTVKMMIKGHQHHFKYAATSLNGPRKFHLANASDPGFSIGMESKRCGTIAVFDDQESAQAFLCKLEKGEQSILAITEKVRAIYHSIFPTGWPEQKGAEQYMEFSRSTSGRFRRFCTCHWSSEPISSDNRFRQFVVRNLEFGWFLVIKHGDIEEIWIQDAEILLRLGDPQQGFVAIVTASNETAMKLAEDIAAKQVHVIEQNKSILQMGGTFMTRIPVPGVTADGPN